MQPSAATTPYSGPPSFAGVLADVAAAELKFPPARELDGLEDDIATISYEQALRTHGRFRGAPGSADLRRPALPPPAQPQSALPQAQPPIANASPQVSLFSQPAASAPATGRKSASITLRMSAAESDQLRRRAAEAGLSVSAYLRSCAFEVESLRAQVKDTLAKLRTGAEPRARVSLWRRFFPRG